jgi:hypothetical protein
MLVGAQARNDFNQLKAQWEKNIEKITERELSPFDIERVYANFDGTVALFHLHFQGFIDDDFMYEANATFERLRSDLHLAVQKGSQIYRHEEHKRKIELLEAYGVLAKNLGINVAVLALGILSAALGIKLL